MTHTGIVGNEVSLTSLISLASLTSQTDWEWIAMPNSVISSTLCYFPWGSPLLRLPPSGQLLL